MTSADRVSGMLLLAFSALVMQQARALPYWAADAPGPGFVPLWLGVLLACLSIALIVRPAASRGHDAAAAATWRPVVIVVAFTAGAAALSLAAGLVLASGLFTAVTLAYLRPGHVRANIAASVLTPLVMWLVFVRWLAVPLPAGPLGF